MNPQNQKDFRLQQTVTLTTDGDLSGATQPIAPAPVDRARDIGRPFIKDFRGTDMTKDFHPSVLPADAPEPVEEEIVDPKDLSAPVSVDSSVSLTKPDDDSSATPTTTASVVKVNTRPRVSGPSTQAS